MEPMTQVGMLVVNTLVGLYLMVVVLRFLLQLVRADFYNPISQFIVKASNPPLLPLRRLIPGFGGIDLASLVLAIIVQAIGIALILFLNGIIPEPQMLLWAVVGVLSLILKIYFWGLLISIIASWIAPGSYNPALILINQILEPVTRPIRRIMPDMGGLDLSPLVVFLLIQVTEILVVKGLAQLLAIPRGVIMGV